MASVIVRIADNLVVDASDLDTLNYDVSLFENLHPVTNPIPAGENPKKYMKDAGGNIVKRPVADLIAEFADEQLANQKAKWAALKAAIPDAEPWKAALIDLGTALGWD